MKHQETVIIIDFGGQYAQLIARRVRECGVYCEILPYNKPAEEILSHNPKGIIFSGGPASVNMENAPQLDEGVFKAGVPILGICYGMQLMAKGLGGTVASPENMNMAIRNFTRTEAVRFLKTFQKDCCMDEPRRCGHRYACRFWPDRTYGTDAHRSDG